jgi:tetratricopeptide (TPR) repeat protein
LIHAFNADDNARAQEFLNQAIEVDPNFSQAYGWLSFSLMRDHWLGFTEDRERALAEQLDAGRKAVELDPSDPLAHRFYSLALHWNGRLGAALEEAETAIHLNPNNAEAYGTLGSILGTMGRTDEAVHNSKLAVKLNPLDARNPVRTVHITMSYLIAGDFNSAAEWAEKAIQRNAELAEAHFLRAVALGHLDKPVEALDALAECEALRPGFIDQFHASRPYLKQTVIDGFFDGLRKAGWED